MNPKFKEIAKVAGFTSCTPAIQVMLEMYAQEIIAETIAAIWNSDKPWMDSDNMYDVGLAIKERWGLDVQSKD